MKGDRNTKSKMCKKYTVHGKAENVLLQECNFPRVPFTTGSNILYSGGQQSVKHRCSVNFNLKYQNKIALEGKTCR